MARKPFGVVSKSGEFIRQDVLGQYVTKTEDGSRALSDRFENEYTHKGLIKPLYNPESLTRLLELNTYHARCVRTKARDAAGLGWMLESIVQNPSDAQKQQVEAWLNNLTPTLTSTLDQCQVDFEAVGWGALELVRENYAAQGPLTAIKHLPSHTIRMHQDGNRYAQIRGTKTRWFKRAELDADVDMDSGKIYDAGKLPESQRATELVVWINYTPRSDYYGVPDIIPAIGAIHGELSRRDYNIAFFDNFGVPAYAIFITGDFDEGEIDEHGYSEMERAIEDHFKALSNNPHSTLLLTIPTREDGQEVKVEFHKLAVDVKEASFRLYRQDNRDEVLAAHGVPPYRAGITEVGALGQNVATETTEIYKMSVIEPRQNTLEGIVNRYILRGAFEVTDWQFKLAEIDTRDEKHDMEMFKELVKHGAADAAEMRLHFGERFGLEGPPPATLSAEPDIATIEKAVKSFQERMITIATKGGSHANGVPVRS